MAKACPLLILLGDVLDCLTDKCMWYNGATKTCALYALARDGERIAAKLDDLAYKLSSSQGV